MDARHFLGLQPTDDPLRWRLPVTPAVSTPGHFLYGGCGLAAGIVALEAASERPTVWATAQYLTYAPTGTVLDWEVVLAAVGKGTTQARAIGRLGDQEVLTVNAALGLHDLEVSGTWVEPPVVPLPEDCPLQEFPAFFAFECRCGFFTQRLYLVPISPHEFGLLTAKFARCCVVAFTEYFFAGCTRRPFRSPFCNRRLFAEHRRDWPVGSGWATAR